MKKGEVWISALLYFGIGIVILTIILAAGTPVIKKIRDKNVVLQTKEVMFMLDKGIKEVAKGGPGTQRVLSIDNEKGMFVFEEDKISCDYQHQDSKNNPGPQE